MAYVIFSSDGINNIGSTPTQIFTEANASIIDGIFLVSTVETSMTVTIYVARTEGMDTTNYINLTVTLPPLGYLDVLKDTTITLIANDVLYAKSDFSTNYFNAFVSFRQLTEL